MDLITFPKIPKVGPTLRLLLLYLYLTFPQSGCLVPSSAERSLRSKGQPTGSQDRGLRYPRSYSNNLARHPQPWQSPEAWSPTPRILSHGHAGWRILGAEVLVYGNFSACGGKKKLLWGRSLLKYILHFTIWNDWDLKLLSSPGPKMNSSTLAPFSCMVAIAAFKAEAQETDALLPQNMERAKREL